MDPVAIFLSYVRSMYDTTGTLQSYTYTYTTIRSLGSVPHNNKQYVPE